MTFRQAFTDFVAAFLLLQASWSGRFDPYLAVGAGGAALAMVILFLWHRRGARVRRKLFSERPVLSEQQWFETYYCQCPRNARLLVLGILRALAGEIGIHWSQLRPDDVFEEQICLRHGYCGWDDLESAEDFLIEWAKQAGYNVDQLPSFQGRLGDFLERIVKLNTASRSRTRSGTL